MKLLIEYYLYICYKIERVHNSLPLCALEISLMKNKLSAIDWCNIAESIFSQDVGGVKLNFIKVKEAINKTMLYYYLGSIQKLTHPLRRWAPRPEMRL